MPAGFKRWALTWLALVLGMILVFNVWAPPRSTRVELPEFMSLLAKGGISSVEAPGVRVSVRMKDGAEFYTDLPNLSPDITEALRAASVRIMVPAGEHESIWFSTIMSLGPIIALIAVWMYSIRYIRRAMAEEVTRVLRDSQGSR